MFYNPPEYAAVIDAMACTAVPVKLICSTDAIFNNTVDGTATANATVTATIINNATPGNAPSPCDANLNLGPLYITDDMPIADSLLYTRGATSLQFDNDDEFVIENDNIVKYTGCFNCAVVGQPTASVRVIPGTPIYYLQQHCPAIFTTRDTQALLTAEFPTGFAETFTLVTILRQFEYSTQDRKRCWLRPGVYEPTTQQVVPINACAESQLAPPVVSGQTAGPVDTGYGIVYGPRYGPFGV